MEEHWKLYSQLFTVVTVVPLHITVYADQSLAVNHRFIIADVVTKEIILIISEVIINFTCIITLIYIINIILVKKKYACTSTRFSSVDSNIK